MNRGKTGVNTRLSTNDNEFYDGASRNNPNFATVELRFRPRLQSTLFTPAVLKDLQLP